MKPRLYLLFIPLCVLACVSHSAGTTDPEQSIVDRIRTIRELRTQIAADYWPGFDAPEFDVPLHYYTDSVCYAVNPLPEYRDAFAAQLIYHGDGIEIYKRALPDTLAFHMETHLNFDDPSACDGNMPTIACSSPEMTRRTVPDVVSDSLWLPMVLHEYAHGFQYRQPGFAQAFAREMAVFDESELSRLHKRVAWFDRAVKDENTALLAALETTDRTARASCIRLFRTLRRDRKQRMAAEMGDSTVRAEEIYESMEGMARYVEAHAGMLLGTYSGDEAWMCDTDSSGYFFATGYNLIRLIDRCGADKSQLLTGELLPLERFLPVATDNK